jgi:hypothetical protein
MCFSTTASFVSGAVLTVIGVATLKKVQSPAQLLFAAFPLIFAIQQFVEGFVWITLNNEKYNVWSHVPITIFLIFAQVIWTTWVPLSFFVLEKKRTRKSALFVLTVIGLLISIYHAYCMLFYTYSASNTPGHIYYQLHFPLQPAFIVSIFYLLTIVLPPFFSSINKTSLLGLFLFVSFIITRMVFHDYVISVWCFFAALVSSLVFLIMKKTGAEDPVKQGCQ